MTDPALADLIRPVEPLRPGDTLAAAARRMVAAGCALPVVDERGRFRAVLSEEDLLRALVPGYISDLHRSGFLRGDAPELFRHAHEAAARRVADLVLPERDVLEGDCSESHAAGIVIHSGLSAVPVVRDGRPVGIVRALDLLDALAR